MFLLTKTIPYRRQWLAGLSLTIGALTAGMERGWTSPYIAELTSPNCTHPLKLTYSEASWVVSLSILGAIFGCALGAVVQDYIGRKCTLLFMSGPLAVGWMLIVTGSSVSWLYANRILTGVAMGMILSAGISFLGEIADPMIRGSLIMVIEYAVSIGTLLRSIMGGLLPMETFSYVCIVLTGFFIVTFVFVPESPYYYITNGDMHKAEESLRWYKEITDVKREMCELQDFLGSKNVSVAERFDELKKPEHLKSILTLLCISLFLYGAGYGSTNRYAEIILTNSKLDVITPSVVVMALTFSTIVASTLAMILVDKLGKRILLMGSGFGLGIGYILLGSHFHMLSLGIEPKLISWLPVLSLFLVFFSIPCGLSTVKDTLLGEIFPWIIKTPATFVVNTGGAIMCFVASKSFQSYLDVVGEKYVFWTFATSALFSVVFSYFCIPETTGLSLIDIQENLKDNNKADTNSRL